MSRKRPKERKPHTLPEKTIGPPAKARIWSTPTVLSLILGVVGALGVVELRPQIAVSPQEPIDKSQPFSVPFRIDNVGYLSFYVEHVSCYINKIKGLAIPRLTRDTFYFPDWDGIVLDRGGGGTLICYFLRSTNVPNDADLAIVIDYRPYKQIAFGSNRKYFRFKGAYIDNWQWLRQPSADIEADIDNMIKKR